MLLSFANNLRTVFQKPSPGGKETLVLASRTVGHLARAGGSVTANFVEFELKRASAVSTRTVACRINGMDRRIFG